MSGGHGVTKFLVLLPEFFQAKKVIISSLTRGISYRLLTIWVFAEVCLSIQIVGFKQKLFTRKLLFFGELEYCKI